MARGKPVIFNKDQSNRQRLREKRTAEKNLSVPGLPKNPPAELKDAPAGRSAWRALMRAHEQLPAELFNALDRGYLVNYCLAVEARERAADLERETYRFYEDAELELKDLLKARVELRMATRLVNDMAKQIFGTPKSRGGINPPPKDDTPPDDMDLLLEDVTDYVNSGDD